MYDWHIRPSLQHGVLAYERSCWLHVLADPRSHTDTNKREAFAILQVLNRHHFFLLLAPLVDTSIPYVVMVVVLCAVRYHCPP